MMTLYCIDDVVSYLDRYLDVRSVPDDERSLNGLQVENSGRFSRVGAAVDACQASIDAAVASGVSLLLVHHGLFWGGIEPLTGRHGRRVRALHSGDVALYSAHLPLDCHREVGNNWLLARRLGLLDAEPFGTDRGAAIGAIGNRAVAREDLALDLGREVGTPPTVIPGGPRRVTRVAIVTGAGASFLAQARDAGADTLVTGEAPHHAALDAEEWGINLLLGGHYATEAVGVKALAAHVAVRFRVDWEFIDHPTGL
jgi:dinuclear metal center YbgI/SA1388 family protein